MKKGKFMWTKFWDMHSGGHQKEKAALIFVEAPKDEAIKLFEKEFGHHPDNVTCACCGPDYVVYDNESLEALISFHLKQWNISPAQFFMRPDVMVLPKLYP